MKKDNFTFHNEEITDKEFENFKKIFERSIEQVEHFFQDTIDKIEVIVARDHEDMCRTINKTRPLWGVTTHLYGKIYLYNPHIWDEKTTGHSFEDLQSSLAHQIVHVYLQRKKIKLPLWFEDGLAMFVSKDDRTIKRIDDFNRLKQENSIPNFATNPETFKNHPVPAFAYLTAYVFIDYISEKTPKSGLVKFIKSLSSESLFIPLFAKTYCKSLLNMWTEFEKHYER